jgi:LPXTG-motif cell wall-anchored protein
MFKKIRAALLAGIVASIFTISEDFTYLRKKDSNMWLLITIGVLVLILIIGLVYLMRRRNDAPK